MLQQLLDLTDNERSYVDIQAKNNDQIVVLVNNMGGLSNVELGGIAAEICRQLGLDYQITPIRVIQGSFVTSLNGLGFSITLLKVVDTGLGDGKSMADLLDASSACAAWPVGKSSQAGVKAAFAETIDGKDNLSARPSNLRVDAQHFTRSSKVVCKR